MNKEITTFGKKAVLFLLITGIINLSFFLLLEIPTIHAEKNHTFQPRRMWEEFYAQQPNTLELLFIGSSHCVYSFDPEIFDRTLSTKSFNMGTPAQSPITSYYVLKEALEYQTPELIVFELFWEIAMSKYQFTNAYENIRYMKTPERKREFFSHGFSTADKFSLIFPTMRYNDFLERLIPFLLNKNKSKEQYKGKGFIGSFEKVSPEAFENSRFINSNFSPEYIIPERKEYIEKIAALCEKKNLKLILVTSPIPPGSLERVTNYEAIHQYFQTLAESLNLEYIDFNHKTKSPFQNSDFMDDHHLNLYGAEKLSEELGKLIEKKALLR